MGPRLQYTQSFWIMWLIACSLSLLNAGCSSGSSSDPGTATTTSVLSVSPAAPAVAPGGTISFSVSGGVAPYYYSVISPASPTGGYFTGNLYTAPATLATNPLAVTVEISDSAGNTTEIGIGVTTTGVSTLAISPTLPTVAPNGQLTFSATGGTPPYSFTVLTANGGAFTGAVYTAPPTAMTNVIVQVTDAASDIAQTSITVAGTTSTTLTCEGTFTMIVQNGTATLTIIQDDSGNIAGSISNISGGSTAVDSISGTCSITSSGGTIQFDNLSTGSQYTGTIFESLGGTTLDFSGTYVASGKTYSWSAQGQ